METQSVSAVTVNLARSMLPTLTVNRPFMQEFLASEPPCCALGLVAVDGQTSGFIALRTNPAIPSDVMDNGMEFGHALLGNERYEIVQFGFEFYGYGTYTVLINPNNAIAQTVMKSMLDSGDYFFFAMDATTGAVTAFRSEIGERTLQNLVTYWERIEASTTTEMDYRRACRSFALNPDPPSLLMEWVCRENIDYLDLSQDCLDMKPS